MKLPKLYNEGSRRLQDQFDTRRMADRIEEVLVSHKLTDYRALIESRELFFLATSDDRGHPTCSYKGGDRLRINGKATLNRDDVLMVEYPEAQFIVRVRATHVFPNCSRYIHQYKLIERSKFVPKRGCRTPVPEWKRSDWAVDVLPEGDPARSA
jgi:uncharacterized protein